MKALAALAVGLAVAGCSREVDMFPVGPGGTGPGGTGYVDAAIDAVGDAGALAGRVCLVPDARSPQSCASTGAGGLTVTLGSQTTTTADDGSFTLARPQATNLVWRVSGTGIAPSALQYTGDGQVPALDENVYADMVVSMNATLILGNGALIARITKAGLPVAGVVVTPSPTPDSAIYYDGSSVTDWGQDATGPFGVMWVSSIVPGTVQLTLATLDGQVDVAGIPVFADTITFVHAEIP